MVDDLDRLAHDLGQRVRDGRSARGMSLGDLARASGLSKTILSRIEAGEGNPSVETLWRVAKAFDLPMGALLEGDDRPPVRAIPARSGRRVNAESGMASWVVHAQGDARRMEVYELELARGV